MLVQTKGLEAVMASVKGGEIPWDPKSAKGDFFTPTAQAFSNDGMCTRPRLQLSQWRLLIQFPAGQNELDTTVEVTSKITAVLDCAEQLS